jgi:alanine dehydrogenase
VIHYGVCNMPAQTPRTSTFALTAATLPYIIKLADAGAEQAVATSQEMRSALTCLNGTITNEPTAAALARR